MASFGEFFGGTGSNYLVRRVQYVSATGSFVAPTRGKVIILAVAPGGSGAAASTSTSGPVVALGGWAGEIAADFIDVAANDTFTAILGSPGAAVSVTGSSANGNNAGDTIITGPNSYSLTVKGGSGGVFAAASGALTNGSGAGAGSGGSANVMRGRGGRGGDTANTAATATVNNRKATGGGGVNLLFTTSTTDTRGGDANQSGTGPYQTGGGGCGGRGGDGTSVGSTAGGGYGGPAIDNTAALTAIGPNAAGQAVAASPLYLVPGLASFALDYFGGGGYTTTAPGPGGGSGGSAGSTNAGIYGGSGGTGNAANTSNPGMGAGSGASTTTNAATLAATPAGGSSFVVFIHLQEVV